MVGRVSAGLKPRRPELVSSVKPIVNIDLFFLLLKTASKTHDDVRLNNGEVTKRQISDYPLAPLALVPVLSKMFNTCMKLHNIFSKIY